MSGRGRSGHESRFYESVEFWEISKCFWDEMRSNCSRLRAVMPSQKSTTDVDEAVALTLTLELVSSWGHDFRICIYMQNMYMIP